jgi:quinoprotein glucose dehydrogenase
VIAGLTGIGAQPAAQKTPYTTWSDYGGSADSMQYSALTQITKQNVNRLEQAWFFPVPDRKGNFGFNPIVVDGVIYVLGPKDAIVALEADTGKPLWSHVVDGGSPGNRGINYWESADRSDRRLIFGAGGSLRAIDARTGATIRTFGVDGRVNMREGTPRPLGGPSGTPGRVFENLFITGSTTGEGYGSPPGDLRAYDIVSGRLVWTFHTIPHPGEFGYETWPEGAWKWAGGVNAWGEISIDERRGIAYFPLGSPTHDMFGGDRKGANLFGNSLLALDARTGKRLWHFQTVHHDIWDYDLTTAPKLLTVRHNGTRRDIVAQPTKFGLLYVFDRVTGEPLWPIEERPVPKSDVPGEESWPTQPFPTKPPPFARLTFTADDINPLLDDAERERLRAIVKNARSEGVFTPQTLNRDQISVPGELGGSNWAGSAADPTTGVLFVRSADQPAIHRLRLPGAGGGGGGSPAQRGRAVYQQFCESCHGQPEAAGIRTMDRSSLIAVQTLGTERITTRVRTGQGQMPAFGESTISAAQLEALLTYLSNPSAAAGNGGNGGGRGNPPLPPIDGITRYTGPLGSMLRAENGLPAISPPWAELVAYDLNEGTIKWRAPLGSVRALVAKGITNTGNAQRVHRNGPVVTAGGLIFIGTNADGTVRAFDTDTGKVLWERALDANPEGMAAVYEVNGRQFVVFCASYYEQVAPSNIAIFPGKVEAQGYYVFALK